MTIHIHSHDHDHGLEADGPRRDSRRTLLLALGITAVFALIEAFAGWWSNSLALIGDSGHMATDLIALGIGALVAKLSLRPPSSRHSYGLKRAEALGALVNIALMLAVVGFITVSATRRLAAPQPVEGGAVIVVAAIGLIVNLVVVRILHGGEQNLNVRGAMLHVMGDLLGSVAALASGVVIAMTAWYPIDPLLSIFIALLILVGCLRLLREALGIVMESVPRGIDLATVGQTLADVPPVTHVHDLHVWALDSSTYAVSAHVVIANMADWTQCRRRLESALADIGISHATLQPEAPEAFAEQCANDSCGAIYVNRTAIG